MPYKSQKPAGAGKTVALALREVFFVYSWGLLGGAVLLPLTRFWYIGIPPAFLVSAYILASMETGGATGPLAALELRQYSSSGKRGVSIWSTFARIAVTALLLPPMAVCLVTMPLGKRPLQELLTGVRVTELDRRLDPRPKLEIERGVKGAKKRINALIIAPLAASAAMFILDYSAPEVINVQHADTSFELPEHERDLLIQYLELTTLHPEELEYHVRLASLYYRNNMEQDLERELRKISSIDPEHAILLLSDTTAFSFQLLEPRYENITVPDTTITLVTEVPSVEDTAASDTLTVDSLDFQPDTLETAAPDTANDYAPDTLSTPPLEVPDESRTPDDATEEQEVLPENPEPAPEEVTIEPDTLVQP